VPLNKAICKRCINERAPVQGFATWSDGDDSAWADGELNCGITEGDGFTLFAPLRVDGSVPKDCPYAAEQVVSSVAG